MSIVGHRDRTLIAGLAVALIVIFARPIEHHAITFAREAEMRTGLALAPALLILSLAFVFHSISKRQDAKVEKTAAEALAQEATKRALELERLVNFGEALARALDVESVRDVVIQQLPRITGTDESWVLLRTGGHWQPLVGTTTESRRAVERAHERIADHAFAQDALERAGVIQSEGQVVLPLTAGGEALGVLGMRDVLRGSDLKCRYGGEEFLVLLPETPIEGAESPKRSAASSPIWP